MVRKRPGRRRREYSRRLRQPDWQTLRAEVLVRDGWTCRTCGDEATEVHHLTYERFWNERLEDLIAVCRDCNQAARVLGQKMGPATT